MDFLKTVTTGKAYSWTYTKLKNWRLCPKKYMHIDFLPKGHPEKIQQPETQQLTDGNAVHKAMANRVSNGAPLPITMRDYEPWIEIARKGVGVVPGMQLLVEQKMAITREYAPCAYFDHKVWHRYTGDVVKIAGPVGIMIDWKTGKIEEDNQQLAIGACDLFLHYPQLQKIKTSYAWLKFGPDARTDMEITREQAPMVWAHLKPELDQMERDSINLMLPPKPNFTCKAYCDVLQCPHNGKRA